MPELGTSGSLGGPGWTTTQVYPTPDRLPSHRMDGRFCDGLNVVTKVRRPF